MTGNCSRCNRYGALMPSGLGACCHKRYGHLTVYKNTKPFDWEAFARAILFKGKRGDDKTQLVMEEI